MIMLLKEFFDKSLRILNEAKVDDLIAKHPEHEEAIRAYHDADPTPTKKFLPWLVKQHVAGNVTPDDARLHSTLQHFDKVRNTLDNKDHSGYHYNDLANAVGDRVKAKMEQEGKRKAVETVHSDPKTGITAQHIKTREASQDLYGGGEERGGKKGCARGTSWCVSARSEGNLFGHYGRMYTIHDPHDENAPYAVHPNNDWGDGGTITSRHNDGEKPYHEVLEKNPRISKALDAITSHNAKKNKEDMDFHEKLKSPTATPDTIIQGIKHDSHFIHMTAAQHPNATPETISHGLDSKNYKVRLLSARHKNASSDNLSKALNTNTGSMEDHEIHNAALSNPNIQRHHLLSQLDRSDHPDYLQKKIMEHPLIQDHVNKLISNPSQGLSHPNVHVRVQTAQHPNTTGEHVTKALSDPEWQVREAAFDNPHITEKHIMDHFGKEQHPYVQKKMLAHPIFQKWLNKDK